MLRFNKLRPDKPESPGTTLAPGWDEVRAKVSKWGMEAGYLGIDDHLEPRLIVLVAEESIRRFGRCEAKRDRLSLELDTLEAEWNHARGVEDGWRQNFAEPTRGGLIARLRAWLWDLAKLRAARALSRKTAPALRKARADLATAENCCREAEAWSTLALDGLRAEYHFHRIRSAAVRPGSTRPLQIVAATQKENKHETHEYRSIVNA